MHQNLKLGDWVLLKRAHEKDPVIPQYMDGLWVPFEKYTWYDNISVRTPCRHSLKVNGRQAWVDSMKEWTTKYSWMGVSRTIKPENIAAVARASKN